MANKIRHLLHRRSLKSSPFIVNIERDTLEVQNPKAPFAENIEYGELAVNYGKGHEGLFLRNSENEVIQLNTMKHIRYDGAVDKSFEKYLDDRYVNRSGDTMYGDFTITKDWDTDDPKFRYIGSYFLIDSVDTDISGNTFDMIENTTTIDIETGFTNIKEHKYEGIKLDADITNADYSGNTFDVHVIDASYSGKTLTVDIKGENENVCDANLKLNADNVTTTVSCTSSLTFDGQSITSNITADSITNTTDSDSISETVEARSISTDIKTPISNTKIDIDSMSVISTIDTAVTTTTIVSADTEVKINTATTDITITSADTNVNITSATTDLTINTAVTNVNTTSVTTNLTADTANTKFDINTASTVVDIEDMTNNVDVETAKTIVDIVSADTDVNITSATTDLTISTAVTNFVTTSVTTNISATTTNINLEGTTVETNIDTDNINTTIDSNITSYISGTVLTDLVGDYTLRIDNGEGCDSTLTIDVPNIDIDTSCNFSLTVEGVTTYDYNDNVTTTIDGEVKTTIVGNVTETTTGDITKTTNGDVKETLNGNSTATTNGNVTENVTRNVITNITGTTNETHVGDYTLNVNGGSACASNYNINSNNINTNVDCNVVTNISGTTTTTLLDDVTTTINGNVTETITGNVTKTTTGNVDETLNGSSTSTTTGDVIEIVNGSVSERVDGNKEETVSGTSTITVEDGMIINVKDSVNTGCTSTLMINSQNIDTNVSCQVTTDIQGNSTTVINGTESTTITGTSITTIGTHDYNVTELDADVNKTNWSGNTFVMEQATSVSAKTPTFTLSSTTTNITGVTSVNISGTTTDMQGNLLDVDYSNIDLSGSTDIDIESPIIDIDASNYVDINGVVEVHIDSVGGTVDIDGKTTTMDGDLLQITYKNIDIEATTDIDVISSDIDIDVTDFTLSGTTTNLKGTDLDVDYTNIDINDKQIYVNKTVDDKGNSTTEVSVNTDTLNITGTTKIDGALNVTGNVDFDSDLNVDGNSNLVGTLVVSGATTIDDKLKVTGNVDFDSDLNVDGNSNLVGTLVVSGATTIDDTLKVTSLATFNGGIKIPDGYTFEGELNKTLTFTSGDADSGKTYSFDNTSDVTVPYVNNGGDTMTGKLTISSGGLDVTGDVKTSTKFIGKLDKTLTLSSGTFSDKTFNNSDNITVNIPTDISHLSFTGEPSSWSSLDSRYVNVDGDTMNGALNFKVSSAETNATTINTDGSASFGSNVTVSGDLHVVGTISGDTAIYSSDVKLKDNIKKINKYDIATVADVDLMSYTFKKDETHRGRYGVIAQDLETVGLEHLVVTSEDGTKGVDYISFLILKIAQLEKEIEELRNKK